MKKIAAAGVAGLGIAIAAWYFTAEDHNEPTLATNDGHVDNQPVATSAPHFHGDHRDTSNLELDLPKHLSSGVDMFVENSPSEGKNDDWLTGENDTIVWQLSDVGEKVLKEEGFIPDDVNKEAYVEIDANELRTVAVGEYLDLYIPQIEGSYSGEVDYITEHPNGDRTVEANIPGAGQLYSAVITIGKDAIYGNLATQDDVYIMEGNGQYAWIASKSDLVATHSPSHADGVIPDGEVVETDGGVFSIDQESVANP